MGKNVKEKMKVIYITGYGRSGSTLLELVISREYEAFGCGELSYIFDSIQDDEQCECGKKVSNCGFWNRVIKKSGFKMEQNSEYSKLTRQAEGIYSTDYRKKKWQSLWSPFLREVSNLANQEVLIDSSKSTRKTIRRVSLLRSIGCDVGLIHLVRKPSDVMNSSKKGSNQLIEKGVENPVKIGGGYRAGLSWLFSNFSSSIFYKDIPRLTITYEQFVDQTESVLRQIQQRFQLEKRRCNHNRHGVSGNRIRRKDEDIKIKKQIRAPTLLSRTEEYFGRFLNKFYKKFIA